MQRLPTAFLFAQTEMPIDQMQRPVRRVNDDELRAARFTATVAERKQALIAKRPTRQNEIAVSAFAVRHIQLIEMRLRAEMVRQQSGLIVEARTANIAIHFLQANEIGILFLNYFNNPFEAIAPVAADAFMDIVSQQTHRIGSRYRDRATASSVSLLL